MNNKQNNIEERERETGWERERKNVCVREREEGSLSLSKGRRRKVDYY